MKSKAEFVINEGNLLESTVALASWWERYGGEGVPREPSQDAERRWWNTAWSWQLAPCRATAVKSRSSCLTAVDLGASGNLAGQYKNHIKPMCVVGVQHHGGRGGHKNRRQFKEQAR